jgi:predicted phage terminase large subunit-like protein
MNQFQIPTDPDELALLLETLTPGHIDAALASRSLYEYIKLAWPHIEPGYPYIDNWHIQAICEHLQAVSEGDVRRLIINIPPRHMKSLIVSVAWPTWEWITRPHRKFLFASYAASLSIRDAVKSRRLLTSPFYKSNWGSSFSLTGDQNQKQRYENDRTGYRIATSVGGQLTGDGGDFVCIDDPHNVVDSDSEASRISTLEWWDQAIPTRLNDPKKGGFIIIMQRVHERDLSGHILKTARPNEWDHLVLPAEYEAKPLHPVSSSLGFRDPRTKEGELLWPDRFGAGELDTLKRSLGEYGAASQLQQRPAPIGGGLINTKFFQLYPSNRPLPAFDFIVQSYDTAFTDKTKNDPTACTTWGVFTPSPTVDAPSPPPCVMLLDAWHDHLKYPQLRLRMRDEFKFHYGDNPARSPDIIVIESKGSGLSLIADLQRDGLPVRAYNPLRADKTSRIQQCLPIIEDKRVFILESKKHKGEPVDWAAGLLRECSYFPVGEHDDYVDTLSQCLLYLRDASFVVLQERTYDPDEDPDAEHRKRRAGNPYAA